MSSQSGFDQRLIGIGQWRVIQLDRAPDENLTLLNRQAGQLFENLGEAHVCKLTRAIPPCNHSFFGGTKHFALCTPYFSLERA